MKWVRHKTLSDADMKSLVGTTLMEKLLMNRLAVKFETTAEVATSKAMGLMVTDGVFHKRELQGKKYIEILFELTEDLEMIEQKLTQYKMGLD
jgi:hypothetical protein